MSDPLFDTLFRPTIASPAAASAAPVRAAGTRTRAGNAMERTRAALLSGAARAVELNGTKITMSQVAAAAGVAKATLYNHFRTKDAVLGALVVDQVGALVDEFADLALGDALRAAATMISRHPLRRSLARLEPATLARIGSIDDCSEGWRRARVGVAALLPGSPSAGADLVLRWLASFLLTPADPDTIAGDVEVLLFMLPESPERGRVVTSA